MDKNQSLQSLLNGTASEKDVELLKRLLASGDHPRITTTNTRIKMGAHPLGWSLSWFVYSWHVLFVDGCCNVALPTSVSGSMSQFAD